eukprot:gene20374-27144_t
MSEEEVQALGLNWVFGSSTGVKGNVVNLTDGYCERICYLSAHTAIIYDKRTERQVFLQGHCNAITCLATTGDQSIIVTADCGSESLLVLWSTKTGNPVCTVSQPHKAGTVALDISPDGEWLATVGNADPETGEQEIALWSMAALSAGGANTRPNVLTAIPAGDVQTTVKFNMNNLNELMSNGKRRVYFWSHQYPSSQRLKYYSPPLRAKDFKQVVGDFTMSAFVPGSKQALTATSDGDLVVWDEQGITAQMGTRSTDRRAMKLMRIHSDAITFLGTSGDYIVSGGADGHVRFYDPLLRIVAWFEDMDSGPVAAVAFANVLPERQTYGDLGDSLNRFTVPDFIVSTQQSKIISMQCSAFEEYEIEKRRGVLLKDTMLVDIVDLASHPNRAEFSVLGASGILQRWDMVTHKCLDSREFPKMAGSRLAYSRDGGWMVAGFKGGHLHILNTEGLSEIHYARNSSATIRHLACSSTADENNAVMLYSFVPYKQISRWEYIGKAKNHHAKVVTLKFGESPSGQTRLFSIAEDSRIAEYDLAESTPMTGLKTITYKDLPGENKPTALAFAPPLPYYRHHATETMLLLCDESFKIQMYHPDQKEIQAVFLGPTFGGPVQQLIMFRSTPSDGAFLAYSTSERVVGLLAWPMDGDPAKTMGLIAHPGPIGSISISYDGRKLLTTGTGGDLNMWDISTGVLEQSAAASEKENGRWEALVGDAELLSDMKDYFYFAQIKAQGEDSMAPRGISGKVAVSMVPELLRAAGCYPSEEDISVLNNHVRYIASHQDLDTLEEISFDELLALYINHRPLHDVSQEEISAAFAVLTPNGRMGREQLTNALQESGEKMCWDLRLALNELADLRLVLNELAHLRLALNELADLRLVLNELAHLRLALNELADLRLALNELEDFRLALNELMAGRKW